MFFLSIEIRVSDNLPFQITSEEIFDFTGNFDLIWWDDWQLNPISKNISYNPIDIFVNSSSFRFPMRWDFLFICSFG